MSKGRFAAVTAAFRDLARACVALETAFADLEAEDNVPRPRASKDPSVEPVAPGRQKPLKIIPALDGAWVIAGDIDAILCGRDGWQGATDSPANRTEFARAEAAPVAKWPRCVACGDDGAGTGCMACAYRRERQPQSIQTSPFPEVAQRSVGAANISGAVHSGGEPREAAVDIGPRWHGGFTRKGEIAPQPPATTGEDRPVTRAELAKAARRAAHRGYLHDHAQNALHALAEALEEKP